MGAWGAGSFQNDDAADWGHDLTDADDVKFVVASLRAAADASLDDYIEVDVGSNAVAAAEVVAAASGHPGDRSSYSEHLLDWAENNPDAGAPEMRRLACDALRRVMQEESELRDLWHDAGPAEWHASVRELEARLQRD